MKHNFIKKGFIVRTMIKSLLVALILVVTGCGRGSSTTTQNEVKSQKVIFKSGYNSDNKNNQMQKIVMSQDIIDQATKVNMLVLDSNYNVVFDEINPIKISKAGKKVFDDFQKTFTKSGDYQAIYIAKDNQGNEVGRSNWVSFTVSLFDEIFEEEVSVNMGYISFYDYIYIDSIKIYDSSKKVVLNSGKVSFFDNNELWSEEEYFGNKDGSVETELYVRVGVNLDKICFTENEEKTCYLLPEDFDILSKEIDLVNLEKEVVKEIDLIDEKRVCDIRFDSYMPNRNMSLDFKPFQNIEISNCKQDVEIYVQAENYLDELEYELENSGTSGYAFIEKSDIAYEEAFIGVDEGISGKVWYDIHYNPVGVKLGKEYKPKFEITLRDMNGNLVQQETHFMTMTTYGEECEDKAGCNEEEIDIPKK